MKTLILFLLCVLALAGCVSLLKPDSSENTMSHGQLQSPVFDFTHSLTPYLLKIQQHD